MTKSNVIKLNDTVKECLDSLKNEDRKTYNEVIADLILFYNGSK